MKYHHCLKFVNLNTEIIVCCFRSLILPSLESMQNIYSDPDVPGSADYNESEIYHYAAATLQMGELVPPSPAPETRNSKFTNYHQNFASPSHKAQKVPVYPSGFQKTKNDKINQEILQNLTSYPASADQRSALSTPHYIANSSSSEHDGFNSVVYAAPSLHNVDGANTVSLASDNPDIERSKTIKFR